MDWHRKALDEALTIIDGPEPSAKKHLVNKIDELSRSGGGRTGGDKMNGTKTEVWHTGGREAVKVYWRGVNRRAGILAVGSGKKDHKEFGRKGFLDQRADSMMSQN